MIEVIKEKLEEKDDHISDLEEEIQALEEQCEERDEEIQDLEKAYDEDYNDLTKKVEELEQQYKDVLQMFDDGVLKLTPLGESLGYNVVTEYLVLKDRDAVFLLKPGIHKNDGKP